MAQDVTRNNNLEQKQFDIKQKVNNNRALFATNPEKAFSLIDSLIIEAKNIHNFDAELNLLRQKVQYYYYYKVDFSKLVESSNYLKKKSIEYNNPYYHADACLFLFDAYSLNKLYDQALNELYEGTSILEKIKIENDDLFNSKGNFYLAYANYYSLTNDGDNQISNLHKAIKEHSKVENKKKNQTLKYKDYSNLSDAYSRFNKMDSAKMYAEKSLEIGHSLKIMDESSYVNYLVIGQFFQAEKNYEKAIDNYKKAEKISAQNHFLNIEKLYAKMIDVYAELGDDQNKKEYEYKLKDLKLKVSETKNDSLHKILEETKKNDKSSTYLYIIGGSILIILILLFLVLRFRKKSKLLEHQEHLSQEYLQQQSEVDEQSYKDLVEIVKNNNPAFLGEFLKIFPDFFEKLQTVNPNIVQTEVEFCALLKLNLPTKDIARFKNLEPKTVQNKKYRIRKRLNIPENIDIYYWFSQL